MQNILEKRQELIQARQQIGLSGHEGTRGPGVVEDIEDADEGKEVKTVVASKSSSSSSSSSSRPSQYQLQQQRKQRDKPLHSTSDTNLLTHTTSSQAAKPDSRHYNILAPSPSAQVAIL